MDKKIEKILSSFAESITSEERDKVMIFSDTARENDFSRMDDLISAMEEESMLMVVQREDRLSLFAPIELNWMFMFDEEKSGLRIKRL